MLSKEEIEKAKENITKYYYANRGKPRYIKETNFVKIYGRKDKIFFVDGISQKIAKELIYRGYILIGYID